jgi:branched-chain amino acid transport system substrate-binding protein
MTQSILILNGGELMKLVVKILIIAVFAFCTFLNSVEAADVKVLKWAVIAGLSGPSAPWGIAASRGIRMGAEDLGTFAIGGQTYKWEVFDYDSKYSPTETLSALNKAIFTDNIRVGVIGGAGSHPPLLPLLREHKFLDIANIGAGKQFTNPENPTLFRMMPSSDQLIIPFVDDIYKIFKINTVAGMVPNDELGKNDWELLRQVHRERNLPQKIVAEEFFERSTTDFYALLRRILAKKPDMLFTDGGATGTIAMVAKQARELGFTNIIWNPTGSLEPKVLVDTAGKAADNVLNRYWPEPPTTRWADLKKRYENRYKEQMPFQLPEMYPMIFWVVEAMKKANTVDIEKVIPIFADTIYNDHPYGPARWGGEKYYGIKRQVIFPIPLSIMKDGQWKMVVKKEGNL